MTQITFGWVLKPNARDTEGARSLQSNNEKFIAELGDSFNTIWVEDHFQWNDAPVVECWTALVYYAAKHPEYRFGPLVFGQSYRNPALTAKMFATLHWLSKGNMIAGIGAGWKEDEYISYGWPFPKDSQRIAELEDAVQIIRNMWSHSPVSFEGEYYSIKDAYCEPRPDPPPPLLIAGGGEMLTLRVVAKHADWMNVGFCPSATFARKLGALQTHCDDVNRDSNEIKKTYYAVISLHEGDEEPRESNDLHFIQGTPQEVTAELKEFIDLGVEHVMINFTDFPSTKGLELFKEKVVPNL
jgi:alkanesulfonate monooxygenase SsuD/methylene tetrahydromethanopterin reductase-like flavin-dependent oxidoreductase (luciferase family)